FYTDKDVFRSDTFDGTLKPIAHVPDTITGISFPPKGVLVRTKNGERWGIGIPSGQRVAVDPLGAADVEALDDGRALAFNEQGTVFASTDHGAHWSDVTAHVKSTPARVHVVDEEV